MFLWFSHVQLFNERQSHFAVTSSVTILNGGRTYARTSLASFDHQKKPKEVSLLELSKSKSTVQREEGCWCFQKLASCSWEKSYPLLQPGSVFKVCKVLKKVGGSKRKCFDILTLIFGYIKHKPCCYFWAAFTYSFAVHHCRIKRHSRRPCKLCYIVNTRNLLIKKRKTKNRN